MKQRQYFSHNFYHYLHISKIHLIGENNLYTHYTVKKHHCSWELQGMLYKFSR